MMRMRKCLQQLLSLGHPPQKPRKRFCGNFYNRLRIEHLEDRVVPSITEFTIPTANSQPAFIAPAPDGSLFFVESHVNKIGKITSKGVISEFTAPTAGALGSSSGITVGSDGFVYFAEGGVDRIARIRSDFDAGTFAEVQLASGDGPVGIKAAVDGNIYFTELKVNKLGRLPLGFGPSATPVEVGVNGNPIFLTPAPDGNIYFTEEAGDKVAYLPLGFTASTPFVESGLITGSKLGDIHVGPNGNLWFTEFSPDKVGTLARGFAAGAALTEFALPAGATPQSITAGSDGTLYVTELGLNKVAQITLTGTITQLSPPTAGSSPTGITAGEDGNVWFTEKATNKIARITLPKNPKVSNEYPIPTSSSVSFEIAAAPDGSLYFEETAANKIGKITSTGYITQFSVPTPNAFDTGGGGGITVGSDGFVYFTEDSTTINRIARVRTDFDPGTFTEVQLASGVQPTGINAGSDGDVYFAEYLAGKLGRLPLGFGPNATPVEVSIPGNASHFTLAPDHNIYFAEFNGNKVGYIPMGFTSSTAFVESGPISGTNSSYVATDKNGNIWFTEYFSDKVGHLAKGFAAGTSPTEFALPSGAGATNITLGSDGALYVTERSSGKIARMTTSGAITQITPLTAGSVPYGIVGGADGNVWFTEVGANNIGKILLKPPAFNTLSPVRLHSSTGAAALPSPSGDLVPALTTANSSPAGLSPDIVGVGRTPSTPVESPIDFWTDQYLAESHLQAESALNGDTLGSEHASVWRLHAGSRMAFWVEPDLSFLDVAVMLSDNFLPPYLAQ